MAKVFGRATIKVGGITLDTNKGATLETGGVKRTSKMTSKGRAGSSEEQLASKLECSIPHIQSVKIADLKKLVDVTISFETDVGTVYTVPHADIMDPPKTDDQSGDVPLVFEGDEAVETG